METLMCTLESIYQDYRQPRDYQTLPTWLLWKFTCHTLIICNISCDVKRASTNNEFDTLNKIIGCYSKGTSGAALFCLRQYWSRRIQTVTNLVKSLCVNKLIVDSTYWYFVYNVEFDVPNILFKCFSRIDFFHDIWM